MGKIIALDFGLKRTGIAITDESATFAFGLTTIESRQLEDFLRKTIPKEKIEIIVIGEPKKLSNEDTHITENVRLLKTHLEKTFPLQKVLLYDERFTSKLASQAIAGSGLNKKARQSKELIDEVSATILLQSFLASR
ncbi:MAG: Holliday junction resolvase RuvX [Crocinitomicaceae bacterium]|jgi:putative Holliday junction resolvase|nr:Holliday junction resolvase RuvX [Crocinitomicaceae bacterium]